MDRRWYSSTAPWGIAPSARRRRSRKRLPRIALSSHIDTAARVEVPALVMDGGASLQFMPFMRASAERLAGAMPNATHRVLEGQTHDVDIAVLAPVLIDYLT